MLPTFVRKQVMKMDFCFLFPSPVRVVRLSAHMQSLIHACRPFIVKHTPLMLRNFDAKMLLV